MELLLKAGANPSVKNRSHTTPYDDVYLKKKGAIKPLFKKAFESPEMAPWFLVCSVTHPLSYLKGCQP